MATKVEKAPLTLKQKTDKVNTYIAAMVAVSVVIVIVTGLVANVLVRSLVLNTKLIAGEQKAKTDSDTKLNNAPQLVSNYQQLGSSTQRLIADALPNNADFPELVAISENMANSSGVKLSSLAPAESGAAAPSPSSATSQAATPTPYNFTVSVSGTYTNILSFMKNIELSARPIKVATSQLSGTSGTVQATLTLTTYYQGAADISDKQVPVK